MGDIDKMPPFPFYKVNDNHVGWLLQEVLLGDNSGVGQDWELALTAAQLKAKLRELYAEDSTYGYGIIGVGQFQVRLGVFKK